MHSAPAFTIYIQVVPAYVIYCLLSLVGYHTYEPLITLEPFKPA